ncbi:MAG: tripartite tricarboxylate transporter TctB family protein [Spirochaetes bacterium]|nr:tripartite tricarboxylate transporter TctB family protein [Spirochaetota bacterium]
MMELIGLSCMGIGLIYLFIQSWELKGIMVSKDTVGPAGFPQLVIILSFLLLAFIGFTLMKQQRKKEEKMSWDRKKILGIHVLLFFAYLMSLDLLGFVLSTTIYCFLGILNLKYTQTLKSAVFSLLLSGGITILFGRIFLVSLPRGIGVFRELSYFLY